MNSSFLYCERQVSRLIVQMLLLHLPGLPVVSKHKLTKYGDEFVQDSHLFPFSPVQIFHVVPLIIHNQDAIIHLTDTSRICIKLYVTTGSFYHTYSNASRNVVSLLNCQIEWIIYISDFEFLHKNVTISLRDKICN